jgi:hypothetical protein
MIGNFPLPGGHDAQELIFINQPRGQRSIASAVFSLIDAEILMEITALQVYPVLEGLD